MALPERLAEYILALRRVRWKHQLQQRWMRDYELKIGSSTLLAPAGHQIGEFRRCYGLYDRAIEDIAALAGSRRPTGWFVDIGANIGDTAAAMRTHAANRILCIEGCEAFGDIWN